MGSPPPCCTYLTAHVPHNGKNDPVKSSVSFLLNTIPLLPISIHVNAEGPPSGLQGSVCLDPQHVPAQLLPGLVPSLPAPAMVTFVLFEHIKSSSPHLFQGFAQAIPPAGKLFPQTFTWIVSPCPILRKAGLPPYLKSTHPPPLPPNLPYVALLFSGPIEPFSLLHTRNTFILIIIYLPNRRSSRKQGLCLFCH